MTSRRWGIATLIVTAAVFCTGPTCTPTSWELVKVLPPAPDETTPPYECVVEGNELGFVLDIEPGSYADYTVKFLDSAGADKGSVSATRTLRSTVFFNVPSSLSSNATFEAQLWTGGTRIAKDKFRKVPR